jgi:hypothetical protein
MDLRRNVMSRFAAVQEALGADLPDPRLKTRIDMQSGK